MEYIRTRTVNTDIMVNNMDAESLFLKYKRKEKKIWSFLVETILSVSPFHLTCNILLFILRTENVRFNVLRVIVSERCTILYLMPYV